MPSPFNIYSIFSVAVCIFTTPAGSLKFGKILKIPDDTTHPKHPATYIPSLILFLVVVNSAPVNVAGDVGREASEDGLGQKDSQALKDQGDPRSVHTLRVTLP